MSIFLIVFRFVSRLKQTFLLKLLMFYQWNFLEKKKIHKKLKTKIKSQEMQTLLDRYIGKFNMLSSWITISRYEKESNFCQIIHSFGICQNITSPARLERAMADRKMGSFDDRPPGCCTDFQWLIERIWGSLTWVLWVGTCVPCE